MIIDHDFRVAYIKATRRPGSLAIDYDQRPYIDEEIRDFFQELEKWGYKVVKDDS